MEQREKDLIEQANRSGSTVFTHFVDPYTAGEVQGVARSMGLDSTCNGGCTEAERVICAIYAPGNLPQEWPIAPVWITWDSRYGKLTHRDVLGSLLGLGIKRDQVGDIRMTDGAAWICLGSGIASYMENQMESAGRVSVRIKKLDMPPPEPVRGQERMINVATARMDAVLAAALNQSRAGAQQIIRSGAVRLNWRDCDRVDTQLADGDVLSVRGSGRMRIVSLEGLSRKGRQFIRIESLLGKE